MKADLLLILKQIESIGGQTRPLVFENPAIPAEVDAIEKNLGYRITRTMKTIFATLVLSLVITHVSFAQLKVEDLKIDTTITGFHFAANFSGLLVYTPHGKADLDSINPSAFSFGILPNATFASAIKQLDNLINMSKQEGYKHSDVIRRDTLLNGDRAYYISLTETLSGTDYINYVFHAFYFKGDDAVIFVSGDLNNGIYRDRIRQTFFASTR